MTTLEKKCLTASDKAEYIYIPHNPAIHSYAFIQWYVYVFVEDTYENVLRGTIHNSQKLGKT